MFYLSARKWGNKILHRWIDSSGRDRTEEADFEPVLYMEDNTGASKDRIAMVGGHGLGRVSYSSIKEFGDAVKQYARTGIIYGQNNVELQYLSTSYKGEVPFDITKIRLAVIDIEVYSGNGFPKPEEAKEEITAITQYDSIDDKFYVFSTVPWEASKSQLDKSITDRVIYSKFENERSLISAWLGHWKANYPAVVSGWYSDGFDIPYLYNRIEKVFGSSLCKTLSPFGVVRRVELIDKYGEPHTEVDIYGIQALDYKALYLKFTVKPREEYKLGHIAYVELEEKKVDYSEEGSLNDLQQKNPQKYIDYNIVDVSLILRLNEKLQLLPLAYYIAYTAKINMEHVFSPVKTWDALIFNHLDSIGQAPKIVEPGRSKPPYEGAYVKPVQVGSWESVVSFDVASLYPSIIRQWNMCPSTIDAEHSIPYGRYVDEMMDRKMTMPDGDYCIASNGVAFRKDKQGVFPYLVEQLFNDRKVSKAQAKTLKNQAEAAKASGDLKSYATLKFQSSGADAKQGAIKVLLNSLYGACGSVFFRYFDLRLAEGITLTGQVAIKWCERDLNDFVSRASGSVKDRCLAIDTDSVYFCLHDLVLKSFGGMPTIPKQIEFLDKSCKLLEEKVIRPSFKSLFDYARCRDPAVEMKREAIANKAFWMAKKVYALDVYDMEGVRFAEPELEAKGLSLVKSETPEFCRKTLKEAVKIILRGEDPDRMIKYIDETWQKFQVLRPEQMATSTSANELDKWTAPDGYTNICLKGTPRQSRGAIVFNHLLVKHELHRRYERIRAGDKVKLLDLRVPNPAHSKVIGFLQSIPPELDLDGYIDRWSMFQKTFLSALEDMCVVLGVKTKETTDIEDFFS